LTDNMVVILTALNLEYEAVSLRLTGLQLRAHPRGTRFELGTIRGTRCRVALGLTGKGNHAAAVLAERAIEEFSPLAVFFVGVAGALWDSTSLGDVVMATQVYAYHGGTSEDDGLKARPRSWETAHGLVQLASHLGRSGDWAGEDQAPAGERVPRVHFGPIAAGEIVQNSRDSYEARLIREHYNDALAVEMEGAGIAQAGHLSGSPVAVIRGISDMADGTKTTSADGSWQPKAAANAAAFAIRLAEELINERGHVMPEENKAADNASGVHNNNSGSGQVGIQAGQVTGSVVVMGASQHTSVPADLAAELAALRGLLIREHTAGRIDEATYDAARAEVDNANNSLPTDTTENRNSFVLALKRLRGLVADVTDLAARIASLLTTVKGL
jgi:adenosylhomocysteine nucleosidase